MRNTDQLDRPAADKDQVADPPPQPSELGDIAAEADRPTADASRHAEPKDSLTRKSQWSNWSVLAVIILCFFVIVSFGPFGAGNPRRHAGVGKTLSQLKLEPLRDDLKPVRLADLTGRVVLISFFGARSSTSPEVLQQIASIDEPFQDQPALKLLAVSCPRDANQVAGELRRDTWTLLRREKLHLPIYADPHGLTRSAVSRVIGADGLPTTLILDRRGRIRGVWAGFRRGVENEMQQLIGQLLAEG